jgi:hypothetical protein
VLEKRTRSGRVAVLVIVAAAVLGAAAQQPIADFGQPIPGLLPAEFERFRIGLDDFLEVETAEEGLGPSFNAASCAVCHNVPAIGGTSLVSEVRAAFRDVDGSIRPLNNPGGQPLDTLFHLFSNPTHGCQPILPPEANVITRRVPIPTFGAGLVEAIADETILSLADPEPRSSSTWERATSVSDASAGKPSTLRSGPSAPMPTATRWGSRTRSSPPSWRLVSMPNGCACAIRRQTPRTCRIAAPVWPRLTTSKRS